MLNFVPSSYPTMHFIGVTTAQSSIMSIFPAWAKELGIQGVLNGIDFEPGSHPQLYRDTVAHIKADPLSVGALVTTHKVNLFHASRDLFDELDPYAQTLHEVSCLSKNEGRLAGHAMDPITVGQALEELVPPNYWKTNSEHVLILGSGGSALALSLHLHNRSKNGDGPRSITITGVDEKSLAEMRSIHDKIGLSMPIQYCLTTSPFMTDAIVANLAPRSLIVNATGLGKDRPGSPTTDAVCFPMECIVWDFNYRGELDFLRQAKKQSYNRELKIYDGWNYFVISWTMVIGKIFSIKIPTSGPAFDRLRQIAHDLRV